MAMSVDSSKKPSGMKRLRATLTLTNRQKLVAAVVGFPAWIVVAYIAAQAVIVGCIWILQKMGIVPPLDITSPLVNAIFAALVYIVTFVTVIGIPYLLLRKRTTMRRLGLTRLPTWMDILLTVGGAIVYIFLTTVLLSIALKLIPAINPDQIQDVGFHALQNSTQYLLAFATLIILAPIAEETLFRGYLYGNLRRYAPMWVSIIVTSALFGLAHMQWNVGIDTFALSIVMCSLREITGSIWAGILLHMLKNGIAFYFLFIMPAMLH